MKIARNVVECPYIVFFLSDDGKRHSEKVYAETRNAAWLKGKDIALNMTADDEDGSIWEVCDVEVTNTI